MSANERRCDGCGTLSPNCRTINDGEDVVATYCYGCTEYMQLHGIQPGGHEQYELLEANHDE